MTSPKPKWPWIMACLLGAPWGISLLLSVWAWEFVPLGNLLANPERGFGPSFTTPLLDPSLRLAAKSLLGDAGRRRVGDSHLRCAQQAHRPRDP